MFSNGSKISQCVVFVLALSTLVAGSPSITLYEVKSSSYCGTNFHLPGKDYTVLKYNVSAPDDEFRISSFNSPYLITLPEKEFLCYLTDVDSGGCGHYKAHGHDCLCDQISSDEQHLTYNRTADYDTSNVTVVMKWAGRGKAGSIFSDPYQFKQVLTGDMTFVKFSSTFKRSKGIMAAGEDSTELQFDVYGGEIYNISNHENGPQFYYITKDGVHHKGCMSFDRHTGACINHTTSNDQCFCQKQSRCVYRITYKISARVKLGGATVYLLWPGQVNLRSENFILPQVRGTLSIHEIK
ncbi:hypothetical protein ElyMa_003153000 [Elysia marginata]|uniref:Uncharacterized protein n=1 Tax=Elysia marginata TaxID=1093978 RepID=A0AAV4IV97_9GAST|nr:hypothetical protein ElyMa_003153000 [Elysia marginata]